MASPPLPSVPTHSGGKASGMFSLHQLGSIPHWGVCQLWIPELDSWWALPCHLVAWGEKARESTDHCLSTQQAQLLCYAENAEEQSTPSNGSHSQGEGTHVPREGMRVVFCRYAYQGLYMHAWALLEMHTRSLEQIRLRQGTFKDLWLEPMYVHLYCTF